MLDILTAPWIAKKNARTVFKQPRRTPRARGDFVPIIRQSANKALIGGGTYPIFRAPDCTSLHPGWNVSQFSVIGFRGNANPARDGENGLSRQ